MASSFQQTVWLFFFYFMKFGFIVRGKLYENVFTHVSVVDDDLVVLVSAHVLDVHDLTANLFVHSAVQVVEDEFCDVQDCHK